jgi:hypothetical protein
LLSNLGLLRPRLIDMIDGRHELVKLAALIDWGVFEREWAGFFPSHKGRPATEPRLAGLNLLAAIIIYWNTKHLGHAGNSRRRAGLDCSPNLLAHISPLGWAHILLTGEYRWPKR